VSPEKREGKQSRKMCRYSFLELEELLVAYLHQALTLPAGS
jgi:hypothetical protein